MKRDLLYMMHISCLGCVHFTKLGNLAEFLGNNIKAGVFTPFWESDKMCHRWSLTRVPTIKYRLAWKYYYFICVLGGPQTPGKPINRELITYTVHAYMGLVYTYQAWYIYHQAYVYVHTCKYNSNTYLRTPLKNLPQLIKY